MKINIKDGIEYFKGLLLLIKKDRIISDSEFLMMKRFGNLLGFTERFCINSIMGIIENKNITDELPQFSSKELAIKFIKDGFTLAFSDKESHPIEVEWLIETAAKNGIEPKAVNQIREQIAFDMDKSEQMEFDDLIITNP